MNITKKIEKTTKFEKKYEVDVIDFLLISYALLCLSKRSDALTYVTYESIEAWSCCSHKKVKEYITDMHEEGLIFVETFTNKYKKQSLRVIHLSNKFYDLLGVDHARPMLFNKFMSKAIPLTKKRKLSRLLMFIMARHQKLDGTTKRLLDVKRFVGFIAKGKLVRKRETVMSYLHDSIQYKEKGFGLVSGSKRFHDQEYFYFEKLSTPDAFDANIERKIREALAELRKLSLVRAEKCEGVNIHYLQFSLGEYNIPDLSNETIRLGSDNVPSTNVLSLLLHSREYYKDETEINRLKTQKERTKKAKRYARLSNIVKYFKNNDFEKATQYYHENKNGFKRDNKKEISYFLSQALFRLIKVSVFDEHSCIVVTYQNGVQKLEKPDANRFVRSMMVNQVWKLFNNQDIEGFCDWGCDFNSHVYEQNKGEAFVKWRKIDWKPFVDNHLRESKRRQRKLSAIYDSLKPTLLFGDKEYREFVRRLYYIESTFFVRLIMLLQYPDRRRTDADLYYLPRLELKYQKEFNTTDPLKHYLKMKEIEKAINAELERYSGVSKQVHELMSKISKFGFTDELMKEVEVLRKEGQKKKDIVQIPLLRPIKTASIDWEGGSAIPDFEAEDERLASLGLNTKNIEYTTEEKKSSVKKQINSLCNMFVGNR
jgi:hypothetical protein